MEFWIKAAQLLLSLSILVVLHEFGHFLPAKWFKTRVEKFYLFFNPGFSLLKYKKGDTEYGLGWLPLGGYVKIAGMIDESMDTEQMKKPAQPWEFRSKPAWQRLIIMVGGVTVNLILGFIIFSAVLFTWGEDWLPAENATWGVTCDSRMYDYGFQEGDLLLSLDGKPLKSISDLRVDLLLDDAKTISVNREGKVFDVALPEDFGQLMVDSNIRVPFEVRIPCVIGELEADFPADKAGLLPGDSLIQVNEVSSFFFSDLSKEIRNNANGTVGITFVRNNEIKSITCDVTENGTIGFQNHGNIARWFKTAHQDYSLAESIPAGMIFAKDELVKYVVSMKFLFSKSGASQIGGFGTIGNLFGAEWDWQVFWKRTAWLSLILAFMNILPIPALDGGHVMFLIYEIVAGKAPGQKFMERAQIVGIILLLALLLFANGNDLYRYFFK
jgi:regulator of sigma E protease